MVNPIPGMAAERAGIEPGMQLVAVNGRRYTSDILREALRARLPLELLVRNEDYYRNCTVDYRDGEKYPHMEREPGAPDLLSEMIKPLAPPTTSSARR